MGLLGYSDSIFFGFLVIILYPPTNRQLYLVGRDGSRRGVISFPKLFGIICGIFFPYFFKCLDLSGGVLLNFTRPQPRNISAHQSKIEPNIDNYLPNYHPCFGPFGDPNSRIQNNVREQTRDFWSVL